MGVQVDISYGNMAGGTGVLMAVGKHGKVDGGFDMADGGVYGGGEVWADENGVRGFGSFMSRIVGAYRAGLAIGAVGSRHRGRWLPVELQWESENSEYLAPSPAAIKLELCTLALHSEHNTSSFAHFVNPQYRGLGLVFGVACV
jgi:hypothetical protein